LKLDTDSIKELLKVRKHLHLLKFLTTIAPDSTTVNGNERVKKKLIEAQEAIKKLSTVPSSEVIGNDLIISGFYVAFSDVKKMVADTERGRPEKILHVILFIWNTLYFDESEVSLPGVTLCIIAPHWNIPHSTKVSLKGIEGKEGTLAHASIP